MLRSQRHLVITAASSDYAALVLGLARSLRDGVRGGSFDFKIIDVGLEPSQLEELSGLADVLPVPEFHLPLEHEAHSRSHLAARAVKPFLARYFPGHEIYTWLDADVWVQRVEALDVLARAAASKDVVAVPSLDRSYPYLYDKTSIHYRWMQPVIEDAFGSEVAAEMEFLPVFNSGVYSARGDSPFWDEFAATLRRVFAHARDVRDQPAFNVALYRGGLEVYALPSRFNWLCNHRLPGVDARSGRLVEPLEPHAELDLVHVTSRLVDRSHRVRVSDGRSRQVSLDYLGFTRGLPAS